MSFQQALRVGTLVLTGAALAVAGCTKEFGTGPGSRAGQLTVDVTATGVPGAAFQVMVIGEGIADPVVVNPGDLLYSFSSNDTTKVAVIGAHSSGPLFKFSVPDVTQAASYSVRLLGVAGDDNAMLATTNFTLAAIN